MSELAVGVDIGGTKAAMALLNKTGDLLAKRVIPTDAAVPPEEMIGRIAAGIRELLASEGVPVRKLAGIGIGAPGPLDSRRGIVSRPPYLETWTDVPIVRMMEAEFSVPALLENDASAAAVAEKRFGAGRDCDNFIYMTVSTGIGAGFIADGRLVRGSRGNAGEIGHIPVDPAFGRCFCGLHGCLEMIASGTSIAKHGSAIAGRELTTKDVFDLYQAGHPEIGAFIGRAFSAIGVAAVSLVNTFDPEKIIVGGGVSQVGEPLLEAIRSHVSRYALDAAGRRTAVVPAELQHDEGVIGAAALCFEKEWGK
ncbi:ROK family protein [Indiicoccus explosivorum]|uniref:ROK family protein n=1 Tax=Indiicoccus explosivorum TaxID=1917864 RepID=UPI001F4E969E|nr:ROK family protein [Indiicoccus explosivorum]